MTTPTPGTILYSADGWRIMVWAIKPATPPDPAINNATHAVVVSFRRRNSQRKLLDQCGEWYPHHRLWLGHSYAWCPVGRVPDGVLREVEARLQDQNTPTTEITP